MRIYLLLTLFLCGSAIAIAQESAKAILAKQSPLLRIQTRPYSQESLYWIVCTDLPRFKNYLAHHGLQERIRQEYTPVRLLAIYCSRRILDSLLLPLPDVVFADLPRTPREELIINNHDLSSNQINLIHSHFPTLDGQGLTVSVKENKPDTTDIDLKGRYITTPLASPNISQHAGIMSTIISGAGNSDLTATGAARASSLTSSNFASLLPDANQAYQQYQIAVQNHSYGTGIEYYYGADAAAYDASCVDNPTLLHIFSAGNAGNQTSTIGAYAGIPGYANLTGSFKMAKNILTVGAANKLLAPEVLGSKGPGYDGRVKPELVAFGEDGSSGAAAITSGTTLLLQQAYRSIHGQLPLATVIKAVLLNSADDAGTPGIDYQTGYGNLNAWAALQAIQQGRVTTGVVSEANSHTTPLTLPAGIHQLKVTLCWNDPPATPNAAKALVHDLDLSIVNTTTGQVWLPWVLNHTAHPDSLAKLPVRSRDSLNNQEQVTIEQPLPGNYQINVRGHQLDEAIQSFSLSWQLDTVNKFQWYYPAKGDLLPSGEANILRWKSTLTGTASIAYTTDGIRWHPIETQVDLARGYFQWLPPDTLASALLRMTTAQQAFPTDTFLLTNQLKATTGFNCPDSFLLSWNRPAGIPQFSVFVLGEKYLRLLTTTTDTNLILSKATNQAVHYTVAPMLPNGAYGRKAYTFNYEAQGVGCYIKQFLADQVDHSSRLSIELGTFYGIQTLTLEKKGASGYTDLQIVTPVNQLQYTLTDPVLTRGLNSYRLKIRRTDGVEIYSQPETVYHFQDAAYLVFPNPAAAAGYLQVLSAEPGSGSIVLYNAIGQQVLQYKLLNLHEQISLQRLQRGLYIYQIRQAGNKVQTGKLVIN
ncbi:S8 family peptidase [Paraflavitalea pollutisoli]|uniref:S8 family peptidase n=1 Tax=Paraflavitalea pollutisoli TaxID=3034143 RepID=UPI0023ED3B21|nr:S8 family peptidase [Paraflavitalea sp. H1-2-19X]